MGTWGAGVFQDDTACEVRDAWREASLDGLSEGEATDALVGEFDYLLPDCPHAFWIPLAAAQWATGRLQEDVRDRALALIEDGGDLERLESEYGRALRRRVLHRLATKLRGEQPRARGLRRRRRTHRDKVVFEIGEVIRVASVDGAVEALCAVIGLIPVKHELPDPLIEILLWEGGDLPSDVALEGLASLHEAPRLRMGLPRLFCITTFTAVDIFGPATGECVATGIERPTARRVDLGDGSAPYDVLTWPTFQEWLGSPAFAELVAANCRAARPMPQPPPLRT